MNLYIYSYNNYYNRTVKKAGNSLLDYEEWLHYGPVQGVYGFTPGDGVNTTQVIGSNIQMYDGKGDYLIVHDPITNTIDSRWFIIDTNRDRAGQWTLTLHRDLIVDYYDIIIDSPMFIEKATLPADNPLIFNNENIAVNQIKKDEYLIKDKSDCPWIVGYYSKNITDDNLSGTILTNSLENYYDFQIDTPITSWEFMKYENEPFYTEYQSVYWFIYGQNIVGNAGYITINNSNFNYSTTFVSNNSTLNFGGISVKQYVGPRLYLQFQNNSTNLNNILPAYVPYNNQFETNRFLQYKDAIVKDSLGGFYKIKITPGDNAVITRNIVSGALFEQLQQMMKDALILGTPNSSSFKVVCTVPTYNLEVERLKQLESTWNMTGNKITTVNTPYNIFAIPFGDTTLKHDETTVATSNARDSIAAAASIIQKMDSNLYDIQLLPYCPLPIFEDKTINVQSELQYSLITMPGQNSERIPVSYILNIESSTFTKNILFPDNYKVYYRVNSEAKVSSICDMFKLCSPNWSSEFQFSAARNGGLNSFNIDCEYKPFMPYIHINPDFGKLYGKDFNDARGLICSGDFSLSQITDNWEKYQTENKNFQNIFNRQIENMEVQQQVGRLQDIFGGISGTVSGAVSGALTGSLMTPNTLGGGAGATFGALLSGAGGIADYALNEKLRNEAIDFKKDLFGYQLGNIKALPYTLTKVSSFNNNNKIFPILEYYSCTFEEREAVANKIAWNGMTVMAIGKMKDYINNNWTCKIINDLGESFNIVGKNYIKGQLIRLEFPSNHEGDIHSEDYHVVNAISGELYKGVFIWD